MPTESDNTLVVSALNPPTAAQCSMVPCGETDSSPSGVRWRAFEGGCSWTGLRLDFLHDRFADAGARCGFRQHLEINRRRRFAGHGPHSSRLAK